MKQLTLITVAMIIICTTSFASKDTVIIYKDPRLDLFTVKEAAVNKLTAKMTSSGQYRGYRLQVINTRNREAAFKAKSDLLQLFPDQKTYILFQSPYFKVRVGNFLQKPEAVSFQQQLARKFHQNAYIVEDIIEYTPGDEEEPALN
ncbi:MAG TPA: SPOR domain-containing protein [Panacibacter sp.]|nr:SPOR domain-containing protein [Panacibacter sp.]